jgi:hypothetical protein
MGIGRNLERMVDAVNVENLADWRDQGDQELPLFGELRRQAEDPGDHDELTAERNSR